MPELTVVDQIFWLHLGDGENRLSPSFITDFAAALDEVSAADGPRALVTVASGKFWSNGLDLDWLGANPDQVESYVGSVHGLMARLLTLGVPSIAVLQGHTFAAGAMLALAHDCRIMREDRGYFCLPEVNVGIPFTPGMSALIQARLSPKVAHEAMTSGRRYTAVEATASGIVDAAGPIGDLRDLAAGHAAELAPTAGGTLEKIRTQMYRRVIDQLAAT